MFVLKAEVEGGRDGTDDDNAICPGKAGEFVLRDDILKFELCSKDVDEWTVGCSKSIPAKIFPPLLLGADDVKAGEGIDAETWDVDEAEDDGVDSDDNDDGDGIRGIEDVNPADVCGVDDFEDFDFDFTTFVSLLVDFVVLVTSIESSDLPNEDKLKDF